MSKLAKPQDFKKINFYIILLIIFLIFLTIFEVIIPFAVAFILAYLINPIKTFFDNYFNKAVSSFLSILFLVIFVLSALILVTPIIIKQTEHLISIVPDYIDNVETIIKDFKHNYIIQEKLKELNYVSFLKPVLENLISSTNKLLNNSIAFFNNFFNIILTLIITFYMTLEFNKIKFFIFDFAKKSKLTDFPVLINEIDIVLSKFIRGQGLICFILSMFYSIALFFLGVQFGVLLGLFAGLISFVPYVGAFVGGGMAIILGFFQFGISLNLMLVCIVFLFGQILESYYLTPKFIGNAIKLNPVWIIFALLTGAHLAGFVGILISLPVAAVLGVLVRYYFIKVFNHI